MREIKFRAWWQHPDYNPDGSMYIVGSINFTNPQSGEPESTFEGFPTFIGLMQSVNDKVGQNNSKYCTLMQYTGLKDKNGKEIYEGDVVESRSYYRSQVVFDDGAFVLHALEKDTDLQRWTISHFELEVIGNIYKNPELLKT